MSMRVGKKSGQRRKTPRANEKNPGDDEELWEDPAKEMSVCTCIFILLTCSFFL